jgi:hypothetical protein
MWGMYESKHQIFIGSLNRTWLYMYTIIKVHNIKDLRPLPICGFPF